MPLDSVKFQSVLAELQRRGVKLPAPMPTAPSGPAAPIDATGVAPRPAQPVAPVQPTDVQATGAPPAPDYSSPVDVERQLRLKQMKGQLAIQDAANELKRRGINLQLRTQPTAETIVEQQAKEAAENVQKQGDPEAFKQAWRAFFPGKPLPRTPEGAIDYAGGQDDIDVEVDRKKRLEAAKIGAPVVEGLRKEYSGLKEVHDFGQVDAAYKKLLTATDPAATPTPLRDQAAIFQWMKILDPGSTVREGEYASVKNARGIPDTIRNWYNQAISGQVLTPDQRTKLREAAAPIYQGQVDSLLPRIRQFEQQARATGASPENVIPREHLKFLTGPAGAPAAGAPAAGAPAAGAPTGAAPAAPAPVDVKSAAEAPPTAKFIRSPSGRVYRNPKYTGQ